MGTFLKHMARCLFLLFPLTAAAMQAEYRDWFGLSSEQLIEQAWSYSREGRIADSTIVCLTYVANRPARELSEAEKPWCVRACLDLWRIYFYRYYDYSKCFEYLVKARQVADSYQAVVPEIEMDFGCMYQTIAEQSHDAHLNREALKSYTVAFNQAFDAPERNLPLLDDIFANLLFVAFSLEDLAAIVPVWESYQQLPLTADTYYRHYNHLMHAAFTHLLAGEYDEAVAGFEQQLRLLPNSTRHVRHRYVAITNKARAYLAQGRYTAAADELKAAEAIALRTGMKDMRLDVYDLLARCYTYLGQTEEKERYRDLYMQQKDSLINYRQLAGIGEVRFLGQLEQLNQEMDAMRARRTRLNIVLFISVLVIVVVSVSLWVLLRNYRKLKAANTELYRKNVELLKAEDEGRWYRHQYEGGNESAQKAKTRDESGKYKNSTLDEQTKDELYHRILAAMDNTGDVCLPDFSVELLAQRVDSKYKYVSQVIHEKYGSNFNTFVNEYRIKEACKRMGDRARYGNLTIEAIANSVGFRSRSAFAQSFKRVTGLMPSEYQRLAKEN